MLSNGATLAEVAHQLGHAPGSPMTKRYAKFIPAAQQSIANKAQQAMSSLLKHPADQVANTGWYISHGSLSSSSLALSLPHPANSFPTTGQTKKVQIASGINSPLQSSP